MDINRHLKTLYPLPDGWQGSERAFGVRLEDAYRLIQDMFQKSLKTITYEATYTPTANGVTTLTTEDFEMRKLRDYVPLGAVDFSSGGSNMAVTGVNTHSSNIMVLNNMTSSTTQRTARITVLYRKTNL